MSHFHVSVLRFVFCLFEGIFTQMAFLPFKDRVLKPVVSSFKISSKARSYVWLSFTVYHIPFLSEMPQI